MDKAKVIDKLNEILRHEWTGVAQYSQAGFVVCGLGGGAGRVHHVEGSAF